MVVIIIFTFVWKSHSSFTDSSKHNLSQSLKRAPPRLDKAIEPAPGQENG